MNELEQFKKERKKLLKENKPYKNHLFRCARCASMFMESVPTSEGWQPFSLYDCPDCGAPAGYFVRYVKSK